MNYFTNGSSYRLLNFGKPLTYEQQKLLNEETFTMGVQQVCVNLFNEASQVKYFLSEIKANLAEAIYLPEDDSEKNVVLEKLRELSKEIELPNKLISFQDKSLKVKEIKYD